MTKQRKDMGASVRARLLQLAKQRGDDFQLQLTRYANERLLYRLTKSRHGNAYLLKGAALFTLWTGHAHRATRDMDLLGFGEPNIELLRAIFTEVISLDTDDDGVVFDGTTLKVDLVALSNLFAFEGQVLVTAISATFERRGTPLPTGTPTAFTPEFARDATKNVQWVAFVRKAGIAGAGDLKSTIELVELFLRQPLRAATGKQAFVKRWSPPGPWM